MQLPIYLDYAATTPVDPRVAKVMYGCLMQDGNFGNPASRSHIYGWRAEEAVEDARGHVALLINADPREIVWTSGATEANNLALKGAVEAYLLKEPQKKRHSIHIVTSKIEHKAVLDTCAALEATGVSVTYLEPDRYGNISLAQVESVVNENTVLVSLMHVNNEVGVLNEIESVGALCRARNIIFHVDAAQSAGKEIIDVKKMNIDLLSISAHKMYGPKGIGALYVRRTDAFSVAAQIHGGGHERRMRSGTLATHQIAGLGEAARIAFGEREIEQANIHDLRKRFLSGLAGLAGVKLNGATDRHTAGIVNLQFAELEGEGLMMALRELAVSSGSACTSASVEPSYVLKALGVDDAAAHASLRFSIGRFTTAEEIDFAVEKICSVVRSLRKLHDAV